MKKIITKLLPFIAIILALFISCSNDVTDDSSSLSSAPATINDGYIRINYKGDADCLWIWNDFDGSELSKLGSWPEGVKFTHKNGDFVCVDLKLAANPKTLGMIPLKNGENLTGGDVIFSFPTRYNEIFLQGGDTVAYVASDMQTLPNGISSAEFTDGTTITIVGEVTLSSETVTLTDKNGAVDIASFGTNKIILANNIKSTFAANQPYTLSIKTTSGVDTVNVGLATNLVEDWFGSSAVNEIKVSGLKLGVTLNAGNASFKMWAPLASEVSLCLYSDSNSLDNPTETLPMNLGQNGFWILEDVNYGTNKYYKYAIKNGIYTKYVSDIWAYAASADSKASQIANIAEEGIPSGWSNEYYNPWNGTQYSESIIYEMHIRDWSRAVVTDSTGKFLDIANSDKIINHLKDLGITHVQILPMFDYAQTNDDMGYNWGYNPYHYNVPEGRYVTTNYTDGTQAVEEMRQMIKALHDNGIAVIMDVVYNHTSGTGDGSLYDMTVPQYFYRMNGTNYVNGSGCGNEVATNHAMVKYYVIESLKHWMNDYHINGFRFDLMGCLETSTMKEIYEELYNIDPKVLVYGEPWTGGTSAVVDGAVKSAETENGEGFAAFDDNFRDAVKGAEFGGFKRGQLQDVNSDDNIINGLKGKSAQRNGTDIPGLELHYIECHDNYTLFDKLVYSTITDSNLLKEDVIANNFAKAYNSIMSSEASVNDIKQKVKLGGAYILLAQGTPFFNGGQEFLRTKKGNPDSYSADKKGGVKWTNEEGPYNIDDVNTINLDMKDTYKDVYNTYKALIKIRKEIDAFTKGNYVEAVNYKSTNGVIKYTTYDSSDNKYIVYFNGTNADVNCSDSGYLFNINEENGSYTIADAETTISVIPAKSFVILKK